MARPAHSALLAAAFLFAEICIPSVASSETTAAVLASCGLLNASNVEGSEVVIPQDFASGTCWGAFAVLQRAIVKAVDYTSTVFDVCAPLESRRTQLIRIFVDYARRNPKRLHDDFFDTA